MPNMEGHPGKDVESSCATRKGARHKQIPSAPPPRKHRERPGHQKAKDFFPKVAPINDELAQRREAKTAMSDELHEQKLSKRKTNLNYSLATASAHML